MVIIDFISLGFFLSSINLASSIPVIENENENKEHNISILLIIEE